MKTYVIGVCLLAWLSGASGGPCVVAQESPPAGEVSREPAGRDMLLEPQQLATLLHHPGIRVLDVRSEADYAEAHIPGAVRVDAASWVELGKQEGGFHDAAAWGEKIGQLGIDADARVVVYGTRLPDTARVWWTLKYLGLERVAILNGGWDLWVQSELPTQTGSVAVDAVPFVPRFQPHRLEELQSLKSAVQAGSVTVVDARSEQEFTGEEVRGDRGGHIPGAKNLEWTELLAEDGRFLGPDRLRELFLERGIGPDQTAVTC